MKSLTSLILICSAFTVGQAIAQVAGGAPLGLDGVRAGDLTSLVVIFFIVRWMTTHLDAKDRAFSELIAKNLDIIEQKDVRYETMARECRESSEKLLHRMIEIESKQ